MSTTTEFTIVAVVIAALLGAALHFNRVQAFPPVTAANASAPAAMIGAWPVTTGSLGR
jgi:hypothetical protein